MTAYVGDFGLSRILAEDNNQISQDITSLVGIKGTIGYAAPGIYYSTIPCISCHFLLYIKVYAIIFFRKV